MTLDAHNLDVSSRADLDAFGQTIARWEVFNSSNILLSGRLQFSSLYLPGGVPITNISFHSADIALATGTHQWFCLYSQALEKLCVTANDTSTAWAANTTKTLTVSGGLTVPSSDLYYVGVCVVATTMPTLRVSNAMVPSLSAKAPIKVGFSTASLTDPASAPATAAALTANDVIPIAWIT